MSWTPTAQVFDLTPIADNLLGYIETHDADAFTWAGTSGEFAATYTNSGGRLQTQFPSLMILTQEWETKLGDHLIAEYQLVLEGTVSGPETNDLVLKTKQVAQAVESMVMNIPSGTLTSGASPAISHAALIECQTVHDMVRGLVNVSGFVQVFQVRCKWMVVAPAY